MSIYCRQSSVKVKFSGESLAEQLVVWLTSEGKTNRSKKKSNFYLYRGSRAEAISSFFRHHNGSHECRFTQSSETRSHESQRFYLCLGNF